MYLLTFIKIVQNHMLLLKNKNVIEHIVTAWIMGK